MSREPRWIEPHTLVEVTTVTFQNRPLLTPSKKLNDLFTGVLAKAQTLYEMPICAVVVLSTHYHLLAIPRDVQHLANFMQHLNANLSKEIGRLQGWTGSLWKGRYQLVPVDDDEPSQVRRLRYLLAGGVKEFLVDTVAEWPGIHSAHPMIEGEPLKGHWFNRTEENHATQGRKHQKALNPYQFATGRWVNPLATTLLGPPPRGDLASPSGRFGALHR